MGVCSHSSQLSSLQPWLKAVEGAAFEPGEPARTVVTWWDRRALFSWETFFWNLYSIAIDRSCLIVRTWCPPVDRQCSDAFAARPARRFLLDWTASLTRPSHTHRLLLSMQTYSAEACHCCMVIDCFESTQCVALLQKLRRGHVRKRYRIQCNLTCDHMVRARGSVQACRFSTGA